MGNTQIVTILGAHKIKASYQRIRILEFLMKNRIHPTVEDIYGKLSGEIPTLSKTTVYNTLKVLVKKKIIAPVTVEENEVRYDYSEGTHLHFKCKQCGRLYDIFQKHDLLEGKEIDGHLIDEHHFYFRGRCKECRKV